MKRSAITLLAGIALSIEAPAYAAPDRTALDTLIAQFEAADANSDSAAYRALADRTVAEARRIYPAGHPEIAARTLYVAQAMASVGELDKAQIEVDRIVPELEKVPSYRASWRNALSLQGYILNFRGDHAGALAINEKVAADYAADPAGQGTRDHAVTLSNLAASYLEHGRLDDALRRNAEAIRMGLALTPVPADVAIWSANRVTYLYTAGRTEEAVATAQDGIARAGGALGPNHPAMASLYANLGAILLRLNRPHDAMAPIRQAFELIEKASGAPNQNSATMRVQFAQALLRAGKFEDAIAFLDAATPIIDAQLGAQSDRSLVARDTRLMALIALGRGAEAEVLARELLAARDARLPEGHRDRAGARENLAKAAFAQGDWPTARDAAAQAVALRTKMLSADHPDLLLSRAFLLRVEDRGNMRPEAGLVADAREVFAALTFNAQLARGSLQAERLRPAYGWLAELFARRGAVDDAFRAQQWAARNSLDDVLAAASSERAAGSDPALTATLAERRALVSARQGLEARVDGNMARPDPAFDLATLRSELAANRQAIAALDAGLPTAQQAQLLFAPASLAEMQAADAPGRVNAMITDLGDGWLVTISGAGKVHQALLSPAIPVDDLARRLRESAAPESDTPLDRTASTALFAALFPGDLGTIVRNAHQLSVIANGALATVPIGLLSPDRGGRQLLLERMAIVRRVSAPRRQTVPQTQARDTLIAFGGVAGAAVQNSIATRSPGLARAIAQLPDLPDSRRELSALGEAIGAGTARLMVGADATEAALRQVHVPPGAVLAFATHGLLSGELDGLAEPALLLTPAGDDDGLLKPSEIGTMGLPARLVILSACNTAAASAADRPQLSGLVQGFFLAGAQGVMATHWPIRDDAARRLSVGTVRGIDAGLAPPEALRRAIAAVRKGSDGEPALDHPALWAAFELFEAN